MKFTVRLFNFHGNEFRTTFPVDRFDSVNPKMKLWYLTTKPTYLLAYSILSNGYLFKFNLRELIR